MGLDLLLTWASLPQGRDPGWDAAQQAVEEIRFEQIWTGAIGDYFPWEGWLEGHEDPPHPEGVYQAVTSAQSQLRASLAVFRGALEDPDFPELLSLDLGNRVLYLTGGESVGEDPHAFLEPFIDVAGFGLLDAAGFEDVDHWFGDPAGLDDGDWDDDDRVFVAIGRLMVDLARDLGDAVEVGRSRGWVDQFEEAWGRAASLLREPRPRKRAERERYDSRLGNALYDVALSSLALSLHHDAVGRGESLEAFTDTFVRDTLALVWEHRPDETLALARSRRRWLPDLARATDYVLNLLRAAADPGRESEVEDSLDLRSAATLEEALAVEGLEPALSALAILASVWPQGVSGRSPQSSRSVEPSPLARRYGAARAAKAMAWAAIPKGATPDWEAAEDALDQIPQATIASPNWRYADTFAERVGRGTPKPAAARAQLGEDLQRFREAFEADYRRTFHRIELGGLVVCVSSASRRGVQYEILRLLDAGVLSAAGFWKPSGREVADADVTERPTIAPRG